MIFTIPDKLPIATRFWDLLTSVTQYEENLTSWNNFCHDEDFKLYVQRVLKITILKPDFHLAIILHVPYSNSNVTVGVSLPPFRAIWLVVITIGESGKQVEMDSTFFWYTYHTFWYLKIYENSFCASSIIH